MSIRKYEPQCDITFVVLKEHIADYSIDQRILSLFPDARIVTIDDVLPGAVLTCIEGVNAIEDDHPIIFNDCDHMFRCSSLNDLSEEKTNSYDGLLITFKSDSPKYSYAETDDSGFVIRTVEKKVVSNNAICGAYYFRNKGVFLQNSSDYLTKCDYSEFYMSGVYNCMSNNGFKTGILETDYHISFGTPEEFYSAKTRSEFGDLS